MTETSEPKLPGFDLPCWGEIRAALDKGMNTLSALQRFITFHAPKEDADGSAWRLALSAAISEVIADRDREIERLQAIVDGRFKDAANLRLLSAGPTPDGFQFDIRGEVISLIAEHLASTFRQMGGENYVAMEFSHDELGPLVLTMQRQLGKMPHTVAAEAKAESKARDEEIANLRAAHEAILSKDTVSWLDARIISARALGIEGHPADKRTGAEIAEYKAQEALKA